jgi:hypothetical protein
MHSVIMQCVISIKKDLLYAMLGRCRISCKLQLNIIYDVMWLKCCSFALKYEVLLNCGDLNARKFKFPISEHDIYVFPLFQPRCSI